MSVNAPNAMHGARQPKNIYSDALTVFTLTPSIQSLTNSGAHLFVTSSITPPHSLPVHWCMDPASVSRSLSSASSNRCRCSWSAHAATDALSASTRSTGRSRVVFAPGVSMFLMDFCRATPDPPVDILGDVGLTDLALDAIRPEDFPSSGSLSPSASPSPLFRSPRNSASFCLAVAASKLRSSA